MTLRELLTSPAVGEALLIMALRLARASDPRALDLINCTGWKAPLLIIQEDADAPPPRIDDDLLCSPAVGRALYVVAIRKALAGDYRFFDLVLRSGGRALRRHIQEVADRPSPRIIPCRIEATEESRHDTAA